MSIRIQLYSDTQASTLNRMNDLKFEHRMSLSPLYLSIETSPVIINHGRSASKSRLYSCLRRLVVL